MSIGIIKVHNTPKVRVVTKRVKVNDRNKNKTQVKRNRSASLSCMEAIAVIKKHIRLTLEFSIEINEDGIPLEGPNQEVLAHRKRQNRLLQAILSDQEQLNLYLRYKISGFMGATSWAEWNDYIVGDEVQAEEILEPVIKTLSKSDQKIFSQAKEDRLFYESIESVDECFVDVLDGVNIEIEDAL